MRFNDKKRISNCLEAIEKNIISRHDFLYKSYIQFLDFKIENLRAIYKEYSDNLETYRLKQSSIFELQTKLTPLLMQRAVLSILSGYKDY